MYNLNLFRKKYIKDHPSMKNSTENLNIDRSASFNGKVYPKRKFRFLKT